MDEQARKEAEVKFFGDMYEEQMGLDISEVLVVEDGKYKLLMDMMALSMSSLKLEMTEQEHHRMYTFLQDIMSDDIEALQKKA